MSFTGFKKVGSIGSLRHFEVDMEIDRYIYTAGPLGTKWLEALREGVIKAAKCHRCGGTLFIPPKIYCPTCYSDVEELVDIDQVGYIDHYTVIYRNDNGERLKSPQILALVRFKNVLGGLLHYIDPNDLNKIRKGAKVKPVFKEERKGSITDIKYFKIIEETA